MKSKTCGRETATDIVLDHPTVSRFHACIELANNGLVSVRDTDSANGTFLNRNENWVRIKQVTLCIGDRIRFGDVEVPLERLTAVFGNHSNARLQARHFSIKHGSGSAAKYAKQPDMGPVLQKPRRNPMTGKIEEDGSVSASGQSTNIND